MIPGPCSEVESRASRKRFRRVLHPITSDTIETSFQYLEEGQPTLLAVKRLSQQERNTHVKLLNQQDVKTKVIGFSYLSRVFYKNEICKAIPLTLYIYIYLYIVNRCAEFGKELH